jgi:hypothetical protein
MSLIERCSCGKPLDDCEQRMLALVQERDTWKRRCVEDTARLREVVRHERDNLRGAVDLIRELRAAGIDALGPHAEHEEHERWQQAAKRAHTYLGGQ